MTKKKLYFICIFIFLLLIASGITYYNTYDNIKNDIVKVNSTVTTDTSTIDKALNQTIDELNDNKEDKASSSNLGIENEDFIYTPYLVEDTASLPEVISTYAPNYTYQSIKNAILEKNNISSINDINIGDLILIPKELGN